MITDFGFKWGDVEVTRLTQIKRLKVLGVRIRERDLQISISATGRSIRVWLDGEELK